MAPSPLAETTRSSLNRLSSDKDRLDSLSCMTGEVKARELEDTEVGSAGAETVEVRST